MTNMYWTTPNLFLCNEHRILGLHLAAFFTISPLSGINNNVLTLGAMMSNYSYLWNYE
jgi:hypothetical protein